MRVEDQPAFVLHARPYRETSLLLDALTCDHGRVGLIARGVRRERARWPRALLQPLVPLRLSWVGAGELATLSAVEPSGHPVTLAGESLLCAMYVNELALRLTVRHDAYSDLFAFYTQTLVRLADDTSNSWTLRRFERDLLGEIGYALLLDTEPGGEAIDPGSDYNYIPEHGPVPPRNQSGAVRVRGTALLALALDTRPDSADLAALRRLMRTVIQHHLGGGALHSWSLLTASGG